MTIPSLMSNYEKHTYVVKLKKAYSQLQNAFKRMPLEEECSTGDYGCTYWYSNLGGPEGVRYKCSDEKMERLSNLFKNTENYFGDNTLTYSNGYFKDKSIKGFTTADGITFTCLDGAIIVDVNGVNKGPNQVARDLVFFTVSDSSRINLNSGLNYNDGIVIPSGSREYYEYYNNNEQLYWKNRCSSTSVTAYCTGRVLEEGAMNY